MRDAVVLITKVPMRGSSKTRLIPAIGEDAAAALATAMLKDIINIAKRTDAGTIDFIVNFAPSAEALHLQSLVDDCEASDCWTLSPIKDTYQNIRSDNLTDILSDAFATLSTTHRTVTFIGSDTPQLQVHDILNGIRVSQEGGSFIAPAEDGGYVLLSLPARLGWNAIDVFQPIRWSSEHTLQDQMDRLSAAGCPAGRGHTYSDVDTMDDVWQLFRLCQDMADRGQEVPCYETFEIVKQLLLPTNGYEICR